MMKEVSEEKFNRLLEKHIDLKPCKRCGYPTGEIVVRLPIYGRYGAVSDAVTAEQKPKYTACLIQCSAVSE